jgi:hypothetical protein
MRLRHVHHMSLVQIRGQANRRDFVGAHERYSGNAAVTMISTR